jgi:cyclic pyranopterin phosphate synthase
MPKEGIDYVPKNDLLSYEEMYRMIMILSRHGINKVRITGGEPFARKDLMVLLRQIANIQDMNWHMTTNAVFIGPHIEEMASLGVASVNVSLDALDRKKFHQITRRDHFEVVYENVTRMIEAGIPVKINCVVMKGKNEDQIIPLAKLALKHKVEVRFIEEMPFNGGDAVHPVIDHKEIAGILASEFPDLARKNTSAQTSEIYSSNLLKGTLGIIPAFTRTFCGTCDRLRISATGEVRTCLYGKDQVNIRPLLRDGNTDHEIADALRNVVSKKERNGFEAEKEHSKFPNTSMSVIGG